MKIQLLNPEQHAEILSIYQAFPELTLENKGYEGIYRAGLSPEAKEADKKINLILKDHIIGFSEFQNFKHNKEGEILLRFQYNYSGEGSGVPFIGVGYILLTELLNGFNEFSS